MTDYENDPFGQPSASNYPKPDDIEGSLLLFMPTKPAEMVTNKFWKKEGDPTHQERISVDTIVFGPDGAERFLDMYWSQQVIVRACEQALKPGSKPFVLGRLAKVATKDTRDKLKIGSEPEDFADAWETYLKKGGKGTQPRYVWILTEFTDEDAQTARDYLEGLKKQSDPFAASTSAAE